MLVIQKLNFAKRVNYGYGIFHLSGKYMIIQMSMNIIMKEALAVLFC